MKRRDGDLRSDVEDLVTQSLTEEANAAVWTRFERCLEKLDPPSLELFRDFLDGRSMRELGEARQIDEKSVSDWIHRIRRDLFQCLRGDCKVPQ